MSSLSNITLVKPGISKQKSKIPRGEEVGAFINLHCNTTGLGFVRCGQQSHMETTIIPVADPGKGPPDFSTKLRPEGLKKFFWETAPPLS